MPRAVAGWALFTQPVGFLSWVLRGHRVAGHALARAAATTAAGSTQHRTLLLGAIEA